MGAAIDTLKPAGRTVIQNPRFVLLAVVLSVVMFAASLFSAIIPFVGFIIPLVLTPVFLVAMTGAAHRISNDKPLTVDSVASSISDHTVDVTLPYIILFAAIFSGGLATALLAMLLAVPFLGFDVLAVTSDIPSGGGVLVLFLAWFVLGIAYTIGYVILTTMMQFVDVSVIIGGYTNPKEVVMHTASLLRNHPLSVVGYLTLRGIVASVIVLIPFGMVMLGFVVDGMLGIGMIIVGGLFGFVAFPLSTAFQFVYHTQYYETLTTDQVNPTDVSEVSEDISESA